MRIIGPPSATRWGARAAVIEHYNPHERFLDEMFGHLWEAGETYDIDPVGLIAQSIKETGAGWFGGKVLPEFHNTCGLKIGEPGILPETSGDQPLAHAMFASWEVGAHAHAQHVRAYAGWPVTWETIVDPRYHLVAWRTTPDAWCEHWSNLSGKWAPSATYGMAIQEIMRWLRG